MMFFIVLFNVIGVLCLIFSVKFNTRNLSRLYLLNIFMYIYILLTFPGSVYYSIYYIKNAPVYICDTILLISLTYYLFALSFLSSLIIRNKKIVIFKNIKLYPSYFKLLILFIIFTPFIICYFSITEGYKAILEALHGDILKAYYYRTHATNALNRHGFLMTLPFKIVCPVIGLISYGMYLQTNKKRYLFLCIMATLCICFYNIALIQKYYLVEYIFMMGLVYMIIKNKKMSVYTQMKIFLYIFATIVLMVIIYVGSTGINANRVVNVVFNILNRIFIVNIECLSKYVHAYNNGFQLLYGTSFSNPGHILPYTPFPLTKWIYSNYLASYAQLKYGVVGSAPTNYSGEILLNFGMIGVIIITFIIGFMISLLNALTKHIIDSNKKNPLDVTLLVFLSVNIASISNSSIEYGFSYLTILSIPNWIIIILIILSSKIYCRKRILKC